MLEGAINKSAAIQFSVFSCGKLKTSPVYCNCLTAFTVGVRTSALQASTPQLSVLAQRYTPLRCVLQYGMVKMAVMLQQASAQLNALDHLYATLYVLAEAQWQDLGSMLEGGSAACTAEFS